ncbi:Metalloprotease TldD [Streptomyces xanthophaeus]|uniref:TldD/PmbA family protein n=1 Tax=Streptomyces xanthophaeus TaxID=67385 RepID=UPI00233F01BC|nr:metallopeptidase TldD-related protein [Streptomyces xanthophaeus]WCD84103.1 Metalloprotease TldD [Streptomyces xanthophaeus]
MSTYFAERRETLHLLDSGPGPEFTRGRYRGIGSSHGGGAPGRETWRYRALPAPAGADLDLPAAVRAATGALAEPWPVTYAAEDRLRDLAQRIRRVAAGRDGSPELVVSLRDFDQQVVAGPADRLTGDHRVFQTVNLSATYRGPNGPLTLRRDSATGGADAGDLGPEDLAARLLDELDRAWHEVRGLPLMTLDRGRRTVLLSPGGCALFFHEVCGHPLEGDVVESGTSYLGAARGKAVCPEWVTVVDDPGAPNAVFGYRFDDEGHPATAVPLIEAGTVSGVLHSSASAAQAGEAPNGHGRRMSYLYPAVPRQAHTRVLDGPFAADDVRRPPGEAVWVERMRVRHVHQGSGAFSFLGLEGLLLHDGVPVGRLTDVVIDGDGLSALRGISAVAGDSRSFVGGGGCGKLDQGPLIVGFEQPTVRIDGLDTYARQGGQELR